MPYLFVPLIFNRIEQNIPTLFRVSVAHCMGTKGKDVPIFLTTYLYGTLPLTHQQFLPIAR